MSDFVHLSIPYLRARSQGGDTASPLCQLPITGYAGDEAAALPMTDKPGLVTCPRCASWMERGGVSARRAWLVEVFTKPRKAAA